MQILLTGIVEDSTPRKIGVPPNARATVSLPKGSDLTLTVKVITPSGNAVDLGGAGTGLSLTVRKKPYRYDYPRIVKLASLSGNVGTFLIEPGDTHDFCPGMYVYDVWLTKDGSRDAVIPTSSFQVLESVAATPVRPPPPTLSLVENDTEPLILDFSGVDISAWAIEVHIAYATPLVRAATIVDGPGGIAQVDWLPGDLVPGIWGGEIQITKPGPVVQTSDEYIFDIRAEIA